MAGKKMKRQSPMNGAQVEGFEQAVFNARKEASTPLRWRAVYVKRQIGGSSQAVEDVCNNMEFAGYSLFTMSMNDTEYMLVFKLNEMTV